MAIKKLKGLSLASARRQPGDLRGFKVHLSQEAKEFDLMAGQTTGLTEWDGLGEYMLAWQKPGKTDLKRKKTTKLSKKRARELKALYEGRTFSVVEKIDHGPAWWETGASLWDKRTGTGSKAAPQAPVWGYKLTPKKVPFLNLRHRIDNHVGPVFLQVMQLPEFLRGNEYTPCAPSKDEVTQFLPRGAATQLSLFGVKGVSTPRKYEHKQAAMQRALSEAFRPRDLYPQELIDNPLHLSSNPDDEVGNSWTPVTDNPIDSLIEQEEMDRRVAKALAELERLQTLLGKDKFQMLGMSANGMTNKEISDELRSQGKDVSPDAVKKALQRIRTQLKEVA
jgi:hypothetical protein